MGLTPPLFLTMLKKLCFWWREASLRILLFRMYREIKQNQEQIISHFSQIKERRYGSLPTAPLFHSKAGSQDGSRVSNLRTIHLVKTAENP